MPRRVATDDDWENDGGEGWSPDDEEWTPDDEDDDTVACPHCRVQVHEQAERCPHCGWYISEEDAPPARRPTWIVIGFVLALAVAILWAL